MPSKVTSRSKVVQQKSTTNNHSQRTNQPNNSNNNNSNNNNNSHMTIMVAHEGNNVVPISSSTTHENVDNNMQNQSNNNNMNLSSSNSDHLDDDNNNNNINSKSSNMDNESSSNSSATIIQIHHHHHHNSSNIQPKDISSDDGDDNESKHGGDLLSRIASESQMVGLFWLSIWFVLNVVLALLNKYIFKSTPFNYPVLLSFIHMMVGWVMSVGASAFGLYTSDDNGAAMNSADSKQKNAIRFFIVIFCLNIAFGNISVQIVNLAASQVVRSTTPLFMIVVAYQVLGTMPSVNTFVSVMPIVLGVCLTVVGDVDLNFVSLVVLFIGNLLAALKVVLANKYINQYKLHPLDLLKQLSPMASLVMFVIAFLKGEVTQFYEHLGEQTFKTYVVVLFTGVCAFSLNWTNMMANKYTSPLTMSVTANVKQVLLVVLSIFLYNVPMNLYNTTGISIALLGMFYYSYLKTTESGAGKK